MNNFIKGISTVLDLSPDEPDELLSQINKTRQRLSGSDAEKLRRDWENVGNDIRRSMDKAADK